MDVEIKKYIESMNEYRFIDFSSFRFHLGLFEGQKVVVVKSGVGKVNSAICAQLLIDKFKVSSIIFTGVAGALNKDLEIYDIVVSKDAIQHDVDVTKLGYKRGQIPESDLMIFDADEVLLNSAIKVGEKFSINVLKGRVLSGDQFIGSKDKVEDLRSEFSGDCVEMEGASLAQVCHLNAVPFLIIRSISDKADDSANLNYEDFVSGASVNSFNLVKEIIRDIREFESEKDFFRLNSIKDSIQTIPDFPKKGIQFRDINTLFRNPTTFNLMVDIFVEELIGKDFDVIAGIESRGFILASILANRFNKPLLLIRKKGKLPGDVVSESYELEYGSDSLEIQNGSLEKGDKVLIIDDLIATGGTALASAKLVEKFDAKVFSFLFTIDLPDLKGSSKLRDNSYNVFSLINFEGD